MSVGTTEPFGWDPAPAKFSTDSASCSIGCHQVGGALPTGVWTGPSGGRTLAADWAPKSLARFYAGDGYDAAYAVGASMHHPGHGARWTSSHQREYGG